MLMIIMMQTPNPASEEASRSVVRDFITSVMTNNNSILNNDSDNNIQHLERDSHLSMLRFIGALFGKAIYEVMIYDDDDDDGGGVYDVMKLHQPHHHDACMLWICRVYW